MRITYVVLTCEAYLKTRCRWMRDSWIRHVAKEDRVFFLSGSAHPSDQVVGWNTPDGYDGCAQKYLTFFREMPNDDTDWIVFVDDDTFVVPDRLRACLAHYDPGVSVWIGKRVPDGEVPYLSGGAGIVVSRALYSAVRSYLQSTSVALHTIYSDLELGRWVATRSGVTLISDLRFNSHPHTEEGDLRTAITFHYVTEALAQEYDRILLSGAFVKDLLEPPRLKENLQQPVNLRPVFRIPIRTKRV